MTPESLNIEGWSTFVSYGKYAVVSKNGKVYISMRDDNVGNEPFDFAPSVENYPTSSYWATEDYFVFPFSYGLSFSEKIYANDLQFGDGYTKFTPKHFSQPTDKISAQLSNISDSMAKSVITFLHWKGGEGFYVFLPSPYNRIAKCSAENVSHTITSKDVNSISFDLIESNFLNESYQKPEFQIATINPIGYRDTKNQFFIFTAFCEDSLSIEDFVIYGKLAELRATDIIDTFNGYPEYPYDHPDYAGHLHPIVKNGEVQDFVSFYWAKQASQPTPQSYQRRYTINGDSMLLWIENHASSRTLYIGASDSSSFVTPQYFPMPCVTDSQEIGGNPISGLSLKKAMDLYWNMNAVSFQAEAMYKTEADDYYTESYQSVIYSSDYADPINRVHPIPIARNYNFQTSDPTAFYNLGDAHPGNNNSGQSVFPNFTFENTSEYTGLQARCSFFSSAGVYKTGVYYCQSKSASTIPKLTDKIVAGLDFCWHPSQIYTMLNYISGKTGMLSPHNAGCGVGCSQGVNYSAVEQGCPKDWDFRLDGFLYSSTQENYDKNCGVCNFIGQPSIVQNFSGFSGLYVKKWCCTTTDYWTTYDKFPSVPLYDADYKVKYCWISIEKYATFTPVYLETQSYQTTSTERAYAGKGYTTAQLQYISSTLGLS